MSNLEPKCFEVIGGVDDAIKGTIPKGVSYAILGGVAGSAYESPETVFDTDSRVIHASGARDKSVKRQDDKGKDTSVRDIDVLIIDTLTSQAGKRLKHEISDSVGGNLAVSVFGINEHRNSIRRWDRAKRAAGVVLSQRSVDENGQMFYSMHPVEQQVKEESYQTWRLVTPQGHEVDVLHPVAHLLSYDLRSIGGPRPKNDKKIKQSWKVIDDNFDVANLTGEDGLFHEWKLFGDAMKQLREGNMPLDHPALQADSGRIDMMAYRIKSKPVGCLESNQALVDFALKGPPQKILNVFTRAK